jgi:hypothetical protein
MRLIQLPFLRGQDAKVESKVAPLGVLKRAENVRFERDARLVKRNGYSAHPALTTNDPVPLENISALASRGSEQVAIAEERLYAYLRSTERWADWNPMPRVGVSERIGVASSLGGDAICPSVAVTNGCACVTFEGESALGTFVQAVIFEVDTWQVRHSVRFTGTDQYKRPRVVAVGNQFVIVWLDLFSGNLMLEYFNTVDPLASWVGPFGVATAIYTLAHLYFDLAEYSATHCLLVYQATATSLAALRLTHTGVIANSVTFPAVGPPTIVATPGSVGPVTVAWRNGTSVLVRSWPGSGSNPFGGVAVGNTTINTDAGNQGPPSLAWKNAVEHLVSWSRYETTNEGPVSVFMTVNPATHAVVTSHRVQHIRLVSKVRFDSDERPMYWGVNTSTYDRVYVMCSHRVGAEQNSAPVQTTLARGVALDYDATTQWVSDLPSYVDSDGNTRLLFAFPWLQAGSVSSADPYVSVDLAATPIGGTERYQSAELGGMLYLSGGLLSCYDGRIVHELGFVLSPDILSLASDTFGGGGLTPGATYQYVMTREWYDAVQQRHVSQVSDLKIVTLGAAHNRVQLRYYPNLPTNRVAHQLLNLQATFACRVHLWRSEANGAILRRITPEDGLDGYTQGIQLIETYLDTASDASIAANPVVYTQGVRGALSGPLQHDPPPPCKYLSLGKERALIGGLENASEVRWSKVFYPNEPIVWSEDFAFRKRVTGKVTAVAFLDDASVIFTRDKVFAVFGDGPDDSGVGQFTEPREIPSEVGCIDWRSLVETPLGLMFQGRSDRIYLLPRGLAAPVWIGEPIHDVLAQYPVITGAKLVTDANVVEFACQDAGENAWIVLCFHLSNQQWTVDVVGAGTGAVVGLATWSGKLALARADAIHIETEGANSDLGAFFGVTIETHALRPHGMQADGRTRKLGALAEYQGSCVLQCELAPDDAQSYPHAQQWTVTGLSAGDVVRREWRLPVQRFGSVRVRIKELQDGSNLTRGLAFTGITLETEPRGGMPRLREAYRG